MSAALIRMSPGRSSRRRRRLRVLVATTVVWAVLFGWALVLVRQGDAPGPSTPVAASVLPTSTGGAWFADDVSAYDAGGDATTPDFSIDTEGALSADAQQATDATAYVSER